MNWTELNSNLALYLGRLKSRFPHVDEAALRSSDGYDDLIDHVARSHDLTPFEAHQEVDDWIFVENLARQTADFRAG